MHADAIYLDSQVGTTINRGAAVGIITDAIVAASATMAALIAAIRAVKVHADQEYYKEELIRALGFGQNISLGSITTVAQLVAQTQAGASTDTAMLV